MIQVKVQDLIFLNYIVPVGEFYNALKDNKLYYIINFTGFQQPPIVRNFIINTSFDTAEYAISGYSLS